MRINDETVRSIRKDIGRDFSNSINKSRVSRDYLSRSAGVTRKVIWSIENGRENYNINSYIKLVGTLGELSKETININPLKAIKKYNTTKKCTVIEEIVCDYFNISQEALKSKSRDTHYTSARFICWRLEKDFTRIHMSEIARRFNKKQHSTIISGLKTLQNMIDTNHSWGEDYKDIKKFVEGKFEIKKV